MANVEKMIPYIIKWETGVIDNSLDNKELFEKAKKSKGGFTNDPDDNGGATCVGVTIGAYAGYCKKKGYPAPTAERLKNIAYEVWAEILKSLYWDRWKADEIKNQSIAEYVVDWCWGSGFHGIKIPQRLLGVKDDGIVGVQTIKALNGKDAESFFEVMRKERIDFYERIVERTPSQGKFLKGWINRANDLKFKEN